MGLLPPGSKVKDFCFYPKSVHRWIKGDEAGNEDIVDKIQEGFVCYISGRRCSLDLIQEYMDPVSKGPDPSIEAKQRRDRLTAGLQFDDVDPEKLEEIKAEEENKKIEEKKANLQKELQEIESKKETKSPQPKSPETKSPVRLILEANQNSDIKMINVNLPVSIPDPNVIELLKKSFPSNDIESEILDMIMNSLSDDEVKNTIKLTVQTLLKNGSSRNI